MNPVRFGKFITYSNTTTLLSVVILLCGCHQFGGPRLRCGAFFGSPIGMEFTDVKDLGKHSYEFAMYEKNGMLYTCQAGFIDIAHVRESADRTAYLQKITYQNLIHGRRTFSFHVIEPSKYWVTLLYPENWNDITKQEKQAIAKEVSIRLGQYLAHTTLIWHEMITWYGFATSGIFSDRISAFSWEDTYSDVLGVTLAGKALRDEQHSYDEAMTELIYQRLKDLGVQPIHVAREAAKQIEGKWYTGGFYFLVDMKMRNLDVGLDDNYITPWLVPGICRDARPRSCPVPRVESIRNFGFDVDVEIEPHIFEKEKIYHSIGLAKDGLVRPKVDFPKIMVQIAEKEHETVISAAAR